MALCISLCLILLTATFGFSSCSSSAEVKMSTDLQLQRIDDIAALLPEAVRESGKLVGVAETTFAPGEFLSDDNHSLIGYDIDLLIAVAKVLGLEPSMEQASFDTIIPLVGTKYDVGISSFSYSEERLEAVDFVTYMYSGFEAAMRAGETGEVEAMFDANPDAQFLAFCGQEVGTQMGTAGEEYVDAANDSCLENGEKAVQIKRWGMQADVTTALLGGKIDMLVADSPVTGFAVRQSAGKLEVVPQNLDSSYFGIIVKKGEDQLSLAINKAIQYLIDSGGYDKILAHWGVEDCRISHSVIATEAKPLSDEYLEGEENEQK
jgi:polar amino acid transport system substrate-binding protein